MNAGEVERRRLAARVVAASVALGAIDGRGQHAADRVYAHAMALGRAELARWADALDLELRRAGRALTLDSVPTREVGQGDLFAEEGET